MTYGIELSDVADMEVQEALIWWISRSPAQAGRWHDGLVNAFESLRELPYRCPVAPESSCFRLEVRKLLYGNYRILFTLVDADDDGELDTVRVLHVRHGARRPLTEE